MTGKQDRLEQYEDSLFALLMDCVAEEEGRRAMELNTALGEDPEAAVPEEMRKRGEKTIRKAFSSQRRGKAGQGLWKGVQTAAVVVLLVAATLTFSMAGFPDLKASVFNMVLNTLEDHTEFSFVPAREEQMTDPNLFIEPGWLPEDFVLEEDESIERCAWKRYLHADSNASVYIEKLYPITVGMDTEEANVESIEVQGYPAKLVAKNHEVRIIWIDSEDGIVYIISTEWVPVEDALRIAENLS